MLRAGSCLRTRFITRVPSGSPLRSSTSPRLPGAFSSAFLGPASKCTNSAMDIALGEVFTGVFTNSDELWSELKVAGEHEHDRFWRMPLSDDYAVQISGSKTRRRSRTSFPHICLGLWRRSLDGRCDGGQTMLKTTQNLVLP